MSRPSACPAGTSSASNAPAGSPSPASRKKNSSTKGHEKARKKAPRQKGKQAKRRPGKGAADRRTAEKAGAAAAGPFPPLPVQAQLRRRRQDPGGRPAQEGEDPAGR